MKRRYQMHCLFRSNVGDVKMMPLLSYMTNIMRILRQIFFNKKFKVNSMSVWKGNVEYIMTQGGTKRQYQRCNIHLSTPPPFRI